MEEEGREGGRKQEESREREAVGNMMSESLYMIDIVGHRGGHFLPICSMIKKTLGADLRGLLLGIPILIFSKN